MTLGELVRKAREDIGWDQTRLAAEAGYSQAAISDIEAGRTVAPRAWRKLAAALGIEEEFFRTVMVREGNDRSVREHKNLQDFFRRYPDVMSYKGAPLVLEMINTAIGAGDWIRASQFAESLQADITRQEQPSPNATIAGPIERPDPNSIPVHGRAKGGDDGKYEFNGDVIGWEPRPAKLRGISGVYAVYIDGESMYPRYKAGETVVAQPGRPIARGDDVIVQLAADEENETPYGYVKEFVRWTPTKLILSQFNPAREIEFARDQVVSVHRIVHADR